MSIENNKTYKVISYTNNTVTHLGKLPGKDVKALLKGYEYDADYELWYTAKATKAYDVIEA